jgi:hypothetical protein
VLHDEAALAHLPQRHARRRAADRGHLAIGELEQLAQILELVARLLVDDARLAVGEPAAVSTSACRASM